MLNFESRELNNASEVNSSITYNKPISINLESLKDDIRNLILSKDKSLIRAYDYGSMSNIRNNSGNDSLKSIINVIRDYMSQKYKEDNTKNLTLRKNLDIIILVLESLSINDIDCTSPEISALLLGFLGKNFI